MPRDVPEDRNSDRSAICEAKILTMARIHAMARVYAVKVERRRGCSRDDLVAHGFDPEDVDLHWSEVVRHADALMDAAP